jgi:hypothetical protein
MNDALRADLRSRAGAGSGNAGRCFTFLVDVIANLSDDLTAGFSVQTLIDNIMGADRVATTRAQLGANARTTGNSIKVAADPSETMGNDLVSTLFHEGFHADKSSRTGVRIEDDRLAVAAAKAAGVPLSSNASGTNKFAFGLKCGVAP